MRQQLLLPKRGREYAKDFNTIEPEDSESLRQAKLESWIAKRLGERISKIYPYVDWMVRVDLFGGAVSILCADVSTQHGYVVKLTRSIKEIESMLMKIGGEILERGGISRGAAGAVDVEVVERDLKEVIKGIDHG